MPVVADIEEIFLKITVLTRLQKILQELNMMLPGSGKSRLLRSIGYCTISRARSFMTRTSIDSSLSSNSDYLA